VSERQQAAKRFFELLDRRLLPLARIREKLLAEGLPAEVIESVLAEAVAKGIHSDLQFARAWCRETLRRQPSGRRYLESNLRQKGIEAAVAAAAAAAELSPDDEAAAAHDAAAKRWRRERETDARAEARVARFLASRGFPPRLCREAARDRKPNPEEEAT
jgi:regulatory protein